ncbi:MAG TPA: hypothetical protein VG815_09590, partial [Chloroflexota bacterium]|nr:hypothetical protein [Chloroflexota bacterium]
MVRISLVVRMSLIVASLSVAIGAYSPITMASRGVAPAVRANHGDRDWIRLARTDAYAGIYHAGVMTGITPAHRWTAKPTSSPSLIDAELLKVACPGPADCFAVGFYAVALSGYRPLVEHWNGRAWKVERVPLPAESHLVSTVLDAIACPSRKLCMAVGTYQSGPIYGERTLVEKWNGRAWAVMVARNPNKAGHSKGVLGGLNGVSCPSVSFCIAVGDSFDPSLPFIGTLVERWNGSHWRLMHSPNTSKRKHLVQVSLEAVSCTSRSQCVATGFSDKNGRASKGLPWHAVATLAERWNGKKWSIMHTRNRNLGRNFAGSLPGVACLRRDDCIAVGGFQRPDFGSSTLVERWDGATWRAMRSPNP